MSKFSFKCIVPGCSHHFLVSVNTLDEAIGKVVVDGNAHNFECHPDMPIISDEKIRNLIIKGIKKVE